MASDRNYLYATNSVLSALDEPELTNAEFPNAVGIAKQVKRIIAECHLDLQGKCPDEHWQKTQEILLRRKLTTGLTESFMSKTITFTGVDFGDTFLGDPGDRQIQDCLFQFSTFTPNGADPIDHRQWYKGWKVLDTDQILLASEHLAALQAASLLEEVAYRCIQFRVPLPDDFRDMQNLDRPFDGLDMIPSSVNEIMNRYMQGGDMYEADDPIHYAIGYDEDLPDGSYLGGAVGPFLYYYPIPTSDRLYRLIYQRKAIRLDPTDSLGTDRIDLPEDMVQQLLYRAKTLARIEVRNDAQGAQVYRSLELEKRKDDNARTMSKNDVGRVTPDTDPYRGHFSKSVFSGPQIWKVRP